MRKIPVAFAVAALALLVQAFAAATAMAAGALTYVSATGNDANPCTVQANPCRTLAQAIAQTLTGGEVRLLSSLPGQFPTIPKSVTVNGGGHGMIGTITINNASASVTIRKLSLNGRGAVANGINIVSAVAVHIEKCTAERYTGAGIRIALGTSSELFVLDSVLRDNHDGLVALSSFNIKLTIDNSSFENNVAEGLYFEGGSAAVSRSRFSGNGDSGFVIIDGKANVSRSTAAGNDTGFVLNGASTEINLHSSIARDNSSIGLLVGAGMTARIARSVITNNGIGVQNNGGTVESLDAAPLSLDDVRTNVIAGNGTQVTGAITPIAAQ